MYRAMHPAKIMFRCNRKIRCCGNDVSSRNRELSTILRRYDYRKKNPARITEIVRTFDPERIFFFPTFSCVNRCARIFFFFKNDLTIIVTLPLNYFIVQQRVAACVQLPTGNELFDAVFSPLHV